MLQQTLTHKAQAVAKQACMTKVRNNVRQQSSTTSLTINARLLATLSCQQNCIFIPFVIEVYGGIGKMAQEFLNEVSVFAQDHMTVYSRFDVVNGLKYAIACSNALIALGGYANAVRVLAQHHNLLVCV